eukprot:4142144-Pyramimonas_sp.AAC.3
MRGKLVDRERRIRKGLIQRVRQRRERSAKLASAPSDRVRTYLHAQEKWSNFMERHARLVHFVKYAALLFLNIFVTAYVFFVVEEYPLVDAFYGAVCTVSTVGYGDVTFRKPSSRLFASWWLLVTPVTTVYALNGMSSAFYIHLLGSSTIDTASRVEPSLLFKSASSAELEL